MNNKVMLVYPNYDNKIFPNKSLPVGLGYIAESLENAGVEYEVVDLNIDSVDYFFKRISEFRPGYLGISMMSYRCKKNYDLINSLKISFPQLKIVVGGPHVTANKEKVLFDCPAIDIGIIGEGDHAMVEIIYANILSEVRGLLFRDGEAVRFSGERPFIDNLDDIPFPKYSGFKLENYGNMMVLNVSRGCPYKCIFCGAPRILGKKYRKRSARSMLKEIEYWYHKGYRYFYFNDSNFAIDRKRLADFCDGVVNSKLDAAFIADGLRADHIDRTILEKMRQAGFNAITFGVESGSNKVLRNLKKGETREQIESAIAAATDLNFNVTLFFLIGSPGEDHNDIQESFELATKYNVSRVHFFNLTPIPGTEFYNWAIKKAYYSNESYGAYPQDNFGFSRTALLRTDCMTIDQLNWWLHRAQRIEIQIQMRWFILKFVKKIIGIQLPTNNYHFNRLLWFFSTPAFKSIVKILLKATIWYKKVN